MRPRVFVGVTLIVSAFIAGTMVTRGATVDSIQQWAIVDLQQPTRIAGAIVMGPVLIAHDAQKMAQGKPCTTVYRFVPGKGAADEIVAFHCKPRRAAAVDTFTLITQPGPANEVAGGTMTAYQFAGDDEVHGVPVVR